MNKFVSVLLFTMMVCLVSCGGGDDTYEVSSLMVANSSNSVTKVFIDGEFMGTIPPVIRMKWELPVGTHNIRFEKDSDPSKSMSKDIILNPGHDITLEILWIDDFKST